MTVSRRRLLAGLSAAALAPALAACGAGDSGQSGSTRDRGGEPGALPATVRHKFGSTTITEAPKRVVCVGLLEQDALLALGIAPVATTRWFGDAPGAVFPWATSALGDAPVPTLLPGGDDVPFEKIAGLRPDLIIGQYAGITKRDYELLSKIAPTVAQPKEYVDYGVPWEVSTTTIGRAVGRPAAAERLVRRVQRRIADARAAHPAFDGATAIVAGLYDGLFVYGPQDPRNRLLRDLGFRFPRGLRTVGGSEFGGSISPEQVSRLDQDVLVWVDKPANVDRVTGGLVDKTRAARQGRQVFVSDAEPTFYVAHSMLTPLSIPYVLDRYVPQLAAAVDGRPATRVPVARD